MPTPVQASVLHGQVKFCIYPLLNVQSKYNINMYIKSQTPLTINFRLIQIHTKNRNAKASSKPKKG